MMPTSSRRRSLALLVLALHACHAHAADPEVPMFSFSGFGTLGVVHSSEDQADFTGTQSKPDGAGFSRSWHPGVDSLIAGQVSANPTPRLSAILQVISEQNYDGSYRPHVEWANVIYKVTPDITVRVGRMVLPSLMLTETRKVGYANPWVRPPVEVYSLVPLSSFDGADATFYIPAGTASHRLQATVGRTDSLYPGDGGGSTKSKARGNVTLIDAFELGFFSARVNVGRARITIDALNPLFDAFRQFGPEGEAIASKYTIDDTLVTFAGVGATYDPGKWFVTGEWSRLNSANRFLGGKSGWYLSGGYRIGNFTPFATYARTTANNLSDPGLPLEGLPPEIAGAAAGLNAALNATLAGRIAQDTASVGVRWDFRRNMALKLQFDRTSIASGSTGLVSNIQPGYRLGGKIDLFSASLDFVF
ncbi:hypothetical protein DSM104443_02242 [Usitatibacter rugosus]|uniref:Porin n=1 Tax=Usitatibacter rugosus TaxID=2732067 RepID=A0A6M4GV37_9PROT|nr:hypothetical protein [Usitatibacter rugosus]QJR11170.1 hypothetical protein DSM104443_02242 [Usitatibacter rugosus]